MRGREMKERERNERKGERERKRDFAHTRLISSKDAERLLLSQEPSSICNTDRITRKNNNIKAPIKETLEKRQIFLKSLQNKQ